MMIMYSVLMYAHTHHIHTHTNTHITGSFTCEGCCHTRLHINLPSASAAQTTSSVGLHYQETRIAHQDGNQFTTDNLQMEKSS